jgi:flagellar motor switch protein FliN/FliY
MNTGFIMSDPKMRAAPEVMGAVPSVGAPDGNGGYAGSVAPMPAPQAEAPPPPALKNMDALGFVMDVPVELTVELGRKHVRIGEVLRLGPGSVLELSKSNGEPLDIYVNNRLIARGEAVVVGERYGIRLTEVMVDDGRGRQGNGS